MKEVFQITILALGLTGCGDGLNTSGWKTYRNEEFAFAAKYPPTWKVSRGIDNNTGEALSISLGKSHEMGQPNALLQFTLQRNQNSQGLSIGQWYADQRQKIEMAPAGEHVIVSGKPAVLMRTSGTSGQRNTYFVQVHGTGVLGISYVSQEALDQVYERVLSTVKWME